MPELSDEEHTARQKAVDFVRGSVAPSGDERDPEIERLNARYVAGQLSDSELLDALLAHGRSLPQGKRVQEYFTSFDEAINATKDR